ncbi:DUF6371 domain-containing protein [Epilithonimonas hominis]|uniref:DUF6371 domain-containing protein n=1 Tax=Epilithonimonas hominis TaxID=420404 RepID=UPI00160D4524|nr:DUF6371 domain-containing protein [Epilithonimonas hominis]
MESEYKYQLEKGSRKHLCPQCNKKTFVRFIDVESREYLPYEFGRCDRESKCNYYLNPYAEKYQQDQFTTTYKPQRKSNYVAKCSKKSDPIFFDFETFKKTLQGYDKNTFIQNLLSRVAFPFDVDEVTKVIELYRLGTTSAGAITFPFIDINDGIRAIQVKQFDKNNHTTNTNWLHSIEAKKYDVLPKWLDDYIKQDKRVSCLFGEHLLKRYPNNPIALVEAPKTAIYGSLYFGMPADEKQLIWLAVYNKSSFSFDKLKILQGRNVFVFPDLSKDGSTFREWRAKADQFQRQMKQTGFVFSDLLERFASVEDREQGNDLADILIRHDWRDFRERSDGSDGYDGKTKTYFDYTKAERLTFGLLYFNDEDLRELSSRVFADKSELSFNDAMQILFHLEGLNQQDADDLLDVMSIKKIIIYDCDKWIFRNN